MVRKCLESFGMIWNKLIIKDPNFEFEVHVIEPWKTRFYVIRSLFLNIKSRPKNRFVSITYRFFQQNFVQYFCMHLLYPAQLVLSWYLNITFIYAVNHLVLPLSLSAFKYISFTSFASMVASRLKLELGASGLHVSSTEKPRCNIWPLQQPSSRNKREQNWNTLSKINRYKWV